MSERAQFIASQEEHGERLDVAVARHVTDISRTLAHGLIAEGKVRVNGAGAKASRRLSAGDVVEVEVVLPPSLAAQPENIPLHVLYQDADLAVIDKPAGLVVHPAPGHTGGTLANALVARYPGARDAGPEERPGIVHRLDKDTSGLLVVALRASAQASLQRQIATRTARRVYLALAMGTVQPPTGTIDAPIGRDPKNRQRMAVHVHPARTARTGYQALEYLAGYTLVRATLDTGRTHQIRVHFAALGHPLAGDRLYGGRPVHGLNRQFLHAAELTLHSPSSGREMHFSSPLPPDLEGVLAGVRRGG